jgi:hypothetical protein
MFRHPFQVRVSCSSLEGAAGGGGGGGDGKSGTSNKINIGGGRGQQDTIKLLLLDTTDDENDEMPLLSRDSSSLKEWTLRRWIPGSGLLSDPEPTC